MTAYLVVKKQAGRIYAINDCGPGLEIMVSSEFVREVSPQRPTPPEVVRMLEEAGVVYGIMPEAINRALADGSPVVKAEVAKGLAPSGVIDASIMYNFPIEESNERPLNPYAETVIDSVNIGQVLAIKRPAAAGVDGLDVSGQPVPAPEPKDVRISVKDGVKLIRDGTVAVAAVAGRPVLEGSRQKSIAVRPVYMIHGDVNMEVGNISFGGDIFVAGSVLDGFRLEAGGNIEVMGDVLCAGLFAGRHITVHNKAISATLRAGGSHVVYKQASQILNVLEKRLNDLILAMDLLKNQPGFRTTDLQVKGEGQLIQLLLDLKFKDIPKEIARLAKLLSQADQQLLPELPAVEEILTQKLCNLGPLRLKDKHELDALLAQVQATLDAIERHTAGPANITVDYVQNSALDASGDIIVTGRGVITSELQAGGKILIQRGSVRGGRLGAYEMIKAWELGSNSSVEINVNLLGKCELAVHQVKPVVVVRHATATEVLDRVSQDVRCSVNEEGLIAVTYNNASG